MVRKETQNKVQLQLETATNNKIAISGMGLLELETSLTYCKAKRFK